MTTDTTGPRRLIHPIYRADIDGLRAIAVLSVISFHAFPGSVKGGYVGVDIFFVISGFLISTIIFGSLESGSFSFREFYARRIKRIFPALICVLILSLAFGWIDLFPQEYRRLSANAFFGAIFGANIAAMLQSSYFDPSQEYNPMLHLWSLGIEEQFYIAWPLFLALVWKRRWSFLAVTILIVAASFAANLYATARNPTVAFYSPLPRFWELMIGALLAYLTLHKPGVLEHYRNGQAVLGLALIVAGILSIGADKAFPGWWVLLPTLGTFLAISAGPTAWLNRRLLGNRVLVVIGLISYPLYLWHWPLLSFAKYAASGSNLTILHRATVVVLSFALAAMTYVLLEKRCRRATGGPAVIALTGCMLAVAAAALGGYLSDGVPGRFRDADHVNSAVVNVATKSVTVKGRCFLDEADRRHSAFCQSDLRRPPNLLVWGDSQAAALFPGLVVNSKADQSWALVGLPGCAPLSGVVEGVDPECEELNSAVVRTVISSPGIRSAVLVTATRTLQGLGEARYEVALLRTVGELVAAGKKVVFVIGNPRIIREDRYFNTFCFPRRFEIEIEPRERYCSISRSAHEGAIAPFRRIAMSLRARFPDALVVDPADALCTAASCNVLKDGKALYSYTDHLSDYGSSLVAALIYRANHGLQ